MSDQQNKKKKEKTGPEIIAPLYNGIYVSADLYGPGSKLLGSDFLSSEVSIGVNLKNRYMPTMEIGYGKTDTWNENGIHYESKAPYVRIGADYNMRWKKLNYEDWLYLGIRYGYSSFKYNIENAPIIDPIYGNTIDNPNLTDPIWGGTSIPFSKRGLNGSMSWYELIGGVRTKIYKNFYIGWTIRLRYKLKCNMDHYAQPWYIPGYGKYSSSANGMTYTIIYKFSIGTKKPIIVNHTTKNLSKSGKGKKIQPKHETPFNGN